MRKFNIFGRKGRFSENIKNYKKNYQQHVNTITAYPGSTYEKENDLTFICEIY